MDVKINNTTYQVGVASLSRSVRKEEKYRVTTEDGNVHREIRATYLDFTLSVGNIGQDAYNALVDMLTALDDDATVTVGGATYTGSFDGIQDEVVLEDEDGELLWSNLAFSFSGTVPLEVSP